MENENEFEVTQNELEVTQNQLAAVVEAKRLVDEQQLRATESIGDLTAQTELLADKIRAFEGFYAERDAERTDFLQTQEDMSKRVVAAEESARLANEHLGAFQARADEVAESSQTAINTLTTENVDLKQKLFEAEQSLVSASHELESANKVATSFADDVAAERAASSTEFGTVRQTLATTERELADKSAALDAAIAQIETLETANADLGKSLSELDARITQESSDREEAKKISADWEQTAGSLQIDLETSKAEVERLATQMTGMEQLSEIGALTARFAGKSDVGRLWLQAVTSTATPEVAEAIFRKVLEPPFEAPSIDPIAVEELSK